MLVLNEINMPMNGHVHTVGSLAQILLAQNGYDIKDFSTGDLKPLRRRIMRVVKQLETHNVLELETAATELKTTYYKIKPIVKK